MDPGGALLVIGLVVIAAGFWSALRRGVASRRPDPPFFSEDLERAATQLGLVTVRAAERVEGHIGEVELKISFSRRVALDEERLELWIEAEGPDPSPLTVELHPPRDLQGHPPHPFGIPTGDDALDREAGVVGSRVLAAAVLDRQTRLALRESLRRGLSVRQGRIEGFLPWPGSAESLVLIVRGLADLAQRLARPPDLVPALARNGLEDPIPAIRAGCLGMLANGFADRPEARQSLRGALDDPDPSVRLAAATRLGEEGRPTLLDLAADRSLPRLLSIRAADALGRTLPFQVAEEVLRRAIGGRDRIGVYDRESILAVARMLARLDEPRVVSRLAGLSRLPDLEIAVEATHLLGQRRESEAEEALLAALEHWLAAVREAGVEGLGSVGTVAAIPALRALLANHPLDRGLRRTVEAAVADIQSRATGAEPGQLSLAGGEQGQLTLAGGEAGHVSLAAGDENDPSDTGGRPP